MSQFYNSSLTKAQIDKILNNYSIKYNTFKNEIDSKINNIIKLFLSDILAFLENIEEISNEKKKLKEFENNKRQLTDLTEQLKEKTANERKMKTDIENLQKQLSMFKSKNKTKKEKFVIKKLQHRTALSGMLNTSQTMNEKTLDSIPEKTKTKTIYNNSKILDSSTKNMPIHVKNNSMVARNLNKTPISNNRNKQFTLRTSSTSKDKIIEKNKNNNNKSNIKNSLTKPTVSSFKKYKKLNITTKNKKVTSFRINQSARNIKENKTIESAKKPIIKNSFFNYKKPKKDSIIVETNNSDVTEQFLNAIGYNTQRNYDADESISESKSESKSKSDISQSNSIISEDSISVETNLIDEEIKELQTDEQKIMMLIEQIKDLKNEYDESEKDKEEKKDEESKEVK